MPITPARLFLAFRPQQTTLRASKPWMFLPFSDFDPHAAAAAAAAVGVVGATQSSTFML
jgi:hypothetical protein